MSVRELEDSITIAVRQPRTRLGGDQQFTAIDFDLLLVIGFSMAGIILSVLLLSSETADVLGLL